MINKEAWNKIGMMTLKRIPKEYRENLIKLINQLMEIEYKQLNTIKEMEKTTKDRIKILNDVKKNKLPLIYLKMR